MIINQLKGGLGNQLFQYAVGRQLSIKNGIDFKLDAYGYNDRSLRKYQLHSLNIKTEPATIKEVNHMLLLYYMKGLIGKVLNRYFKNLLIHYYLKIGKIITEKERYKFDPAILTINKDVYICGYWQNEKYFKDIKSVLKQDYQLKEVASPYYLQIQKDILSTQSISVHVRRGDFLKYPEYIICSNEYYQKAMGFISDRVEEAVFYVFSDDLPYAMANIKSKRPIIYVDNCCNDCEELLLMSTCKHHINANSTFSWWGAWLGEEGNTIVITPKNWFSDGRKLYDFVPDRWVRI